MQGRSFFYLLGYMGRLCDKTIWNSQEKVCLSKIMDFFTEGKKAIFKLDWGKIYGYWKIKNQWWNIER